jgi:hypothetical protein
MNTRYIYQFTILLLVLFGLCRSEATDLTRKVIANIVRSAPQLKEDMNKSPASRTTVVSHIVGNGFTTFKQSADLQLYGGVNDSNLIDFLNYVKKALSIPDNYSQYFVENLSLILFSDFNEIVIYRVLFSVDAGGDCKYICVMGQRNLDGTTDWLVGEVGATFTLAPDVLVIEESKSAAWGLYKSKQTKIIQLPKSLNDEQLNVLFKFFEICVFERFAELLKIDVNSEKNFLDY